MKLNEERAVFIANEIGAAVIELIANGMDVNRPNITDYLELKRKTVGNTLYKGVLRNPGPLQEYRKSAGGAGGWRGHVCVERYTDE